jgi:hypothetical protein
LWTPTGTEQIDYAISDTNMHAPDHGFSEADVFMMTTGGEVGEIRVVTGAPTKNDFTLNEALSGTPSTTEEFSIISSTQDALDAQVISTTVLPSIAHGLVAGDFFMMGSGDEESEPRIVASATTDVITINEALSGTPSAAEDWVGCTPTGTDAVESGTTDTILAATAHSILANDLVIMTSGGEINEPRLVSSVTADAITLNAALSGTPSATETFCYKRPKLTGIAVEAGTTDTIITHAGHSAVVGDLFCMKDGGEINELRVVVSVIDTDSFVLNEALSGTPSATEEYLLFTMDNSDGVLIAGQTNTVMMATAHGASANDMFMMYTGGEESEVRYIASVTTDSITLDAALSGTPSATEKFVSVTPDAVDAAEAGLSATRIIATAHSAAVGDEIAMTSGTYDGVVREVTAVGDDIIDLEASLGGAPTAADTFNIQRAVAFSDTKKGKILILNNNLNQPVFLSQDGSTDHLWIKNGGVLTLDLKSNNMQVSGGEYLYVKKDTTSPSSGALYITVIH